MASSSNFDLTYNKLDVVAGGALSNATSTPVSGGSGGSGVTQIVAGTNVTISPSGGTGVVTVNSTAGGGGTVTSVASGTGLTGGPITTSGTLSIASTGVSAASYGTASSVPTIAVNAQGQITSASNTSIAISGGAVSGNIAGNAANVTGTVAIGNGGTGATTAATARTNLGLGTVATQTAPSGTSSQLLANDGSGGFSNVTVSTGLSFTGGVLTASGTSSGVSSITGNNGITPSTLTTGAVTLGLAAITPTSVNGITLSGSGTPTLSVTGTSSISGSSSGTNTGDQTNITGNAGTATKLATGRTIAITGDLAYTSPSFDGSANVTAGGTLASIVTAAGPIGSSTTTPVITIDAKGRVTALSSATIASGSLPSGGTQGQRLIKDSTNAVAWGNDPYLYAEDYGYGLSGNTVTQDTTALQNAVNAAATANATLLIPPGSIHINSAIVIGSVASGYTGRLRIMGCGRKNTRVIQDSAVDGFTFFMADPITCDNAIEINDIGIIGNNNSAATAINIIFPYSGNNGARTCVMVHGIEATGVIGAGSVITQTGGWTNGLAMYSCWAGVVYDCYFGGVIAETIMSGGSYATSGVGSGSGVLISGCINVELTDITSEWFYRGISIPATSVAWSSGSSYSVGTIVSYSGLYYLCYTAIGSSTTAPSSDTSHFIRTRLQSEGIVMDNMTVVSAINALYAESTFVYLTNFLFDNGNFTNNNFISVNLVNARSAYLVGGQVLQNGNANQVKINGGTAVTMSNVDFTQQANMSGASVLITNSATNCVVTGCIFAGQPAVQCDSGTSGCKAPSNIYGTGANIDSGTNYLGDSLGFQTVVTLTGGSATETINVDISRCKLGRQPDGGVAQVVSDTGIACLYYWQDTGNTKSNLVLQFFMFNGTTLPNAGVRYSLRVGP